MFSIVPKFTLLKQAGTISLFFASVLTIVCISLFLNSVTDTRNAFTITASILVAILVPTL